MKAIYRSTFYLIVCGVFSFESFGIALGPCERDLHEVAIYFVPGAESLLPRVENDIPDMLVDEYYSLTPQQVKILRDDIEEAEFIVTQMIHQSGFNSEHELRRGHSYRDVGVQAITLGGWEADRRRRLARLIATYAAHFIDDHVDAKLARLMGYDRSEFYLGVRTLLGHLDKRLQVFYDKLLKKLTELVPTMDRKLFRMGLSRELIGAPLFARNTSFELAEGEKSSNRERILRMHNHMVQSQLPINGSVRRLLYRLEKAPYDRRFLALTAKTVQEIWDAFWPFRNPELNVLTSLFYGPILYHHDDDAEKLLGEVDVSMVIPHRKMKKCLNLVMAELKKRSPEEKRYFLKQAPLVVGTFRRVLMHKRLYKMYARFFKDPEIQRYMPPRVMTVVER